MKKFFAISLLLIYTASFGIETMALGVSTFSTSNKVVVKKHCKKEKSIEAEGANFPTTISTGETELANLQVINAICVTTTLSHFASHSIELIPYFDTQNASVISEAYDSPSLFRDPFPPQS